MLQAEKNRMEGVAPNVRSSLGRMIAALSAEKTRLGKLIIQQIRSHQHLSRDHQLLCTIKGIGSLTAAILWPRWRVPVKSSVPARLLLMPAWLHGAKKAARPCVVTEV
jgi:hypothetical protein